MDWHLATLVTALPEDQILELEVSRKKLCILRKEEKIFAFAATCPHSGAKLCEGWTDAQGRVVCPLHKYRFDPANGRNTSGEGYKLKIFQTELRGDELFVQF